MPVTTAELLRYFQAIGISHGSFPKKPENANRLWDGRTPYIVHPILCACLLASEQKLPLSVRAKGIRVLLFHDVLEDTTADLPKDLRKEVVQGIKDMTVEGARLEWEDIWSLPPDIRLFKLFDKTANLLDTLNTDQEIKKKNRELVNRLIEDVKKNFGMLNIIVIAKALLDKQEV